VQSRRMVEEAVMAVAGSARDPSSLDRARRSMPACDIDKKTESKRPNPNERAGITLSPIELRQRPTLGTPAHHFTQTLRKTHPFQIHCSKKMPPPDRRSTIYREGACITLRDLCNISFCRFFGAQRRDPRVAYNSLKLESPGVKPGRVTPSLCPEIMFKQKRRCEA
jgi:hypothetical protein